MAAKAWKAIVLIAVVMSIVVAAYLLLYREKAPEDSIERTGVIEATEAEVSSKISGRIEWLCCREGDKTEYGAPAVRLDARELRARAAEGSAALAASTEAVEEARASLENARVEREALTHEVEAAKAEVDRSRALAEEARENLARAEGLFKDGYVAKRELDAARAAYDSNAALLESAQARLRGAQANLRNAAVSIRAAQARINAAQARREQAVAEAEVLNAQLDDAAIASPLGGIVSYKAFETGEYINPGAVIYTVYDPKELWARVDIEETSVQNISIGSPAEVQPAGGGSPFAGRVVEIGEAGGFATQRDVTRGRPDIKTFRVKVGIEDPRGGLKPGMTVNVRVRFSK